MSEFGAAATLQVSVSDQELRQARRKIENELGDVNVDVAASAGSTGGASGTAGGLAADGGRNVTDVLNEQTDLLSDAVDILDDIEEMGGVGGGAGGGGGGLVPGGAATSGLLGGLASRLAGLGALGGLATGAGKAAGGIGSLLSILGGGSAALGGAALFSGAGIAAPLAGIFTRPDPESRPRGFTEGERFPGVPGIPTDRGPSGTPMLRTNQLGAIDTEGDVRSEGLRRKSRIDQIQRERDREREETQQERAKLRGVDVNAPITVNLEGTTKQQVERAIDEAKRDVLETVRRQTETRGTDFTAQ